MHSEFGVQSQYNSEQLMLPSYYNCLNFVVRYGRCIFKIYELCDVHLIYGEARCVAMEAARLYHCNNTMSQLVKVNDLRLQTC